MSRFPRRSTWIAGSGYASTQARRGIVDVPTSPDRDGLWVNERWPEHAAPLEDVTWVAADGLRYPDAEITLPVKAELDRPKDNLDLAVTWPLLATLGRRGCATPTAALPRAQVADRPHRLSGRARTAAIRATASFSRSGVVAA